MSTNALDAQIVALTAALTKNTDAEESAKTFMVTLKGLYDAAILAAKNAGATAAQLAQLQAVTDTLGTKADDLSAAIVANTPAA